MRKIHKNISNTSYQINRLFLPTGYLYKLVTGTSCEFLVIILLSSFLIQSYYLSVLFGYGWHEHLAIGDEKAMALYKEDPDNPAIVKWKNSIQSKLDIIDVECYDFTPALYCYNLTNEARNDCLPHLYMDLCKRYIISPIIQDKISPDNYDSLNKPIMNET